MPRSRGRGRLVLRLKPYMDEALAWASRYHAGTCVRGILSVARLPYLFVVFSASYTYHTCACISRSDWKIMTQPPNDVKRRRSRARVHVASLGRARTLDAGCRVVPVFRV